jgi:hypothetical protein
MRRQFPNHEQKRDRRRAKRDRLDTLAQRRRDQTLCTRPDIEVKSSIGHRYLPYPSAY